jgi:hypothetical protein
VNVEGITWHVIVLDPEPFAATKALMTETFGLTPEVEAEGMVLFIMPNGTMLELNEPQAASADCSARSPAWRRSRTPTDASAVQTVASTASTSRSSASTKRRASPLAEHSRRGRHRCPTRCSVRLRACANRKHS